MRATTLLAALAASSLLGLALGGCRKTATAGSNLEQINDAFNSAGLKLDPFVPSDATRFSASRCLTGRIEGVDATLCEYGSPEAAKLGHRAAEEWIGPAPTGTAIDNGRVLLALADRARIDPNGRAIHKITRVFQGKK
jgi:hypothetical protein